MITIRRATYRDRPEIFRFIQCAYHDIWPYRIPERWEWEFVNNPWIRGSELPVFVAVEGTGKIVGQSCALIEQAKIGTEYHYLSWGVDAYVLPDYRNQGLGKRLQQANDESQDIFMSISMAEPVRKMKMSIGAVALDTVPIYRRYNGISANIFRNTGFIRMEKGGKSRLFLLGVELPIIILERMATVVINAWRDFWDATSSKNRISDIVLSQVDVFPEDVDALWSRVAEKFFAIVVRNRRHLNWKYVQQPHMDYIRYTARRAGELCGYIVLRKGKAPEKNFGLISDLFAAPEDSEVILALIQSAVRFFQKEKVDEIIAASTVPQYQKHLRQFGFVKAGEEWPVMHAKVHSPSISASFQPGRWFLGNSDHDWDQYPMAR